MHNITKKKKVAYSLSLLEDKKKKKKKIAYNLSLLEGKKKRKKKCLNEFFQP